MPGRGVEAQVEGKTLRVGGPALLRALGAEVPPSLLAAVERAAAHGQAAATLLDDATPVAVFAVADAVREESREAVQRLHMG